MLKLWIEQYWSDFEDDDTLQVQMAEAVAKIQNPKFAQMISTALIKKV